MGCDIHAYIDFDDFITREGDRFVECFAPDVYIGRNYELFSLMAGVRYDPNRMDGKEPLFEPKGIFERLSWRTTDDYTLWVSSEYPDSNRNCSPENAAKWVECGYSTYWKDETRVTGPDWHSASWLTADELEKVHTAYCEITSPASSWYQSPSQPIHEKEAVNTGKTDDWGYVLVEVGERTFNRPLPQITAIIAAMRALDGDTPGRSRLVFWFDN